MKPNPKGSTPIMPYPLPPAILQNKPNSICGSPILVHLVFTHRICITLPIMAWGFPFILFCQATNVHFERKPA